MYEEKQLEVFMWDLETLKKLNEEREKYLKQQKQKKNREQT